VEASIAVRDRSFVGVEGDRSPKTFLPRPEIFLPPLRIILPSRRYVLHIEKIPVFNAKTRLPANQ
jgi:hypothetical protein